MGRADVSRFFAGKPVRPCPWPLAGCMPPTYSTTCSSHRPALKTTRPAGWVFWERVVLWGKSSKGPEPRPVPHPPQRKARGSASLRCAGLALAARRWGRATPSHHIKTSRGQNDTSAEDREAAQRCKDQNDTTHPFKSQIRKQQRFPEVCCDSLK